MDALFFLKQRASFIRRLYEGAVETFEDQIRRIEAEEEPFVPPYSEDGEPPFMAEWIEADECRGVVGYACISLLAASLHLFLSAWDKQLKMDCGVLDKKEFSDRGWFNGYRKCFRERLHIRWENSPSDLLLLEALVLARNRIQHPDSIHTVRAKYSRQDFVNLGKRLFFTGSGEFDFQDEVDRGEFTWILAPNIQVTQETLMQAVDEVETFCTWLDAEIAH